MNGLRLTICAPNASATQLLSIARWADHWNLGGLWIGDPTAAGVERGDSYITAAAAAVASVTTDLRIGVLLALPEGQHTIRIAEDVAVIDNASGGRMEIGLVAGAAADERWLGRAATFLRSWTDWPVPGGGTVAVTPLPVQPQLPRTVAGPLAAARELDAGWMAVHGGEPESGRRVARRTIAVASPDPSATALIDWLADDPCARVAALREQATRIGAQELLIVLQRDAAAVTERDVETLGRVVVPALRCVPDELAGIVHDAWRWLTEQGALHDAPA